MEPKVLDVALGNLGNVHAEDCGSGKIVDETPSESGYTHHRCQCFGAYRCRGGCKWEPLYLEPPNNSVMKVDLPIPLSDLRLNGFFVRRAVCRLQRTKTSGWSDELPISASGDNSAILGKLCAEQRRQSGMPVSGVNPRRWNTAPGASCVLPISSTHLRLWDRSTDRWSQPIAT